MAAQRCEKSNNKKEKILASALDLFLQKGYNDTKISEIALCAGIGKGTVYEYFNSKEQLFAELFRNTLLNDFSKIADIAQVRGGLKERLIAFCKFQLDIAAQFANRGTAIQSILMEAEVFKQPELRDQIYKMQHETYRVLKSIIDQGIKDGECNPANPAATAIAVIGSIQHYAAIGFNLHPDEFSFNGVDNCQWTANQLADILLYGIKGTVN